MAGRKHIRAVGQQAETKAQSENDAIAETSEGVEASDAIEADEALELTQEELEEEYEELHSSQSFAWIPPTLAVLVAIAWTGYYGWAMQGEILAATSQPAVWVRLLVDWSVPLLLVGVAWLLAMRNSRAEANRFASSAAMLSKESRELEDRLTVVNRELSLAREFLSAQSLELESLGRVASERISTHAHTLQSLIKDNGAQVNAIGSASESALANMTRLRDDLPVVANSARDVSNQVGSAGRTAQEQVDKLVLGFERLNQFGKASEAQVSSLDSEVSGILKRLQTQIDAIEATAGSRLEVLQESTESYRSDLSDAEENALAALKERAAMLQSETQAISEELRTAEEKAMEQLVASKDRFTAHMTASIERLDETDAKAIALANGRVEELNAKMALFQEQLATRDRQFNEQVAKVQERFSTNEAQASEVLAQRLADLDDALAERRDAHLAETEKLEKHSTVIGEQMEQLTALLSTAGDHGEATREALATGLEALDSQLEDKRAKLRETEAEIANLTESGIRLLEIIQSSATFTREDLPEAMKATLDTLNDVEERAQEVSTLMLVTNDKADALASYLVDARSKVDDNDASIEALQSKVAEQSNEALAKINGLRSGLAELAQASETLSGEAQDQLRTSITKLEDATREVFDTLEKGTGEKVDAVARSLSERAVAELERSLRNNSAEAAGKLEQAAAHASGVGREATAHLRDQLAKVNELTINLEQRIARARELAEEQVNNDFSRRMALITDSLNSSAIDLATALSQEVSESSWDAYLKGERGIFTRRAVRLIDSGEAREIAELYENDDEFKANVSRYIHDFEAMLRSVLSTRDGKVLGVTVLGSDVGKLYVVLAQAIERLR